MAAEKIKKEDSKYATVSNNKQRMFLPHSPTFPQSNVNLHTQKNDSLRSIAIPQVGWEENLEMLLAVYKVHALWVFENGSVKVNTKMSPASFRTSPGV